MKKFFAILLTVCLLVSTFTISSYAALLQNFDAPLAADVVLSVYALKTDDTIFSLGEFWVFEDGWSKAMEYAGNVDVMKANAFDRIIVDFYSDWTATNGNFTDDKWWESNGHGFRWDTIFIPENARVTINLNGHTIDRGLTGEINNGEVICISDDADVIINNGTITGGASSFSAGGIYIKDDARVTLNNVHLIKNSTTWDGGAVAVSDGSILTVNGGSFKNNKAIVDEDGYTSAYGGAVYVEDATAMFSGVEFKDNNAPNDVTYAAAIYTKNSVVTIKECIFDGNGTGGDEIEVADSIIHGIDSSIKVIGSTFKGNGGEVKDGGCDYSAIFALENSELTVNTSEFSENLSYFIFNDEDESKIQVSDTKFLNNKSAILRGDSDSSHDNFFKSCTFENNGKYENVSFYEITTLLTFESCDLGDSTINSSDNVVLVNTKAPAGFSLSTGSIFGEGSLTMIVALTALVSSVASAGISFALYKKKSTAETK